MYIRESKDRVPASQSKNMNRPNLEISKTFTDWLMDLTALLALVITLGLVGYNYGLLPDSIPSHFGADGLPDRVGSKVTLFILPLIALAVFSALYFINRLPHRFNYLVHITEENALIQYTLALRMVRTLNAAIQIMFTYITYTTVETAFGKTSGLNTYFVFVLIFVLTGITAVYVTLSIKRK